MTSQRYKEKVAVVTGAGSGFGRAMSLRLGDEGARVFCVDIDSAAAHDTTKTIGEAGGQATSIEADVTRPESMEAMATTVLEQGGRIDVVFANAGVPGSGSAVDMSLEEWNRTIGINLTGAWLTSRYLLPNMMRRRSGAIVNTASIVALTGVERTLAYTASKGGVLAMTREMAADFGPYGIRVNAICPGTVATGFVRAAFARKAEQSGEDPEELLERSYERYALGKPGEPADVAALALFLGSDEARWISGAAYPVDGGYQGVAQAAERP